MPICIQPDSYFDSSKEARLTSTRTSRFRFEYRRTKIQSLRWLDFSGGYCFPVKQTWVKNGKSVFCRGFQDFWNLLSFWYRMKTKHFEILCETTAQSQAGHQSESSRTWAPAYCQGTASLGALTCWLPVGPAIRLLRSWKPWVPGSPASSQEIRRTLPSVLAALCWNWHGPLECFYFGISGGKNAKCKFFWPAPFLSACNIR